MTHRIEVKVVRVDRGRVVRWFCTCGRIGPAQPASNPLAADKASRGGESHLAWMGKRAGHSVGTT